MVHIKNRKTTVPKKKQKCDLSWQQGKKLNNSEPVTEKNNTTPNNFRARLFGQVSLCYQPNQMHYFFMEMHGKIHKVSSSFIPAEYHPPKIGWH